jgi:transposase
MLPKDFPPWQTVYWYFARWQDAGTIEEAHYALREEVRIRDGVTRYPSIGG